MTAAGAVEVTRRAGVRAWPVARRVAWLALVVVAVAAVAAVAAVVGLCWLLWTSIPDRRPVRSQRHLRGLSGAVAEGVRAGLDDRRGRRS